MCVGIEFTSTKEVDKAHVLNVKGCITGRETGFPGDDAGSPPSTIFKPRYSSIKSGI